MPINWEQFLDQAEKIFIFQDGAEFYFDLRRPTGDLDFFSQFDKEIQAQSLFRVSQYRLVKESRVKISRPGQIVISKDSLLRARPHLDRVRDDFKRIMISWGKFGIGDFLKSNY